MSKLKKPTIDALIEKLIEDELIKPKEENSLREILDTAKSGMTNEEIPNFINTLDEKIEASASQIFTPNGINYASFEGVAREAIEVAKIQSTKINETIQNEEKNAQKENIGIELSDEELTVRIKSIDDIYENILGIDHASFSNEEKEKMARDMFESERLTKRLKELVRNGLSPEDAKKQAYEEFGYSENDGKECDRQLASVYTFATDVKKRAEEKGISEDEAFKELRDEKDVRLETCGPEIKNLAKEKISFKDFVKGAVLIVSQKGIEGAEAEIEEVDKEESKYQLKGSDLSIEVLKDNITKREKSRRNLLFWKKLEKALSTKKKEDIEEKKQKDEILQEATDEYLRTDKSLSDIYEALKRNGLGVELEFEEILERVASEFDGISVETIKDFEKNIRINSLTINAYNQAMENDSKPATDVEKYKMVRADNNRMVEEYKNIIEKNMLTIKNLKNIKRRELGIDDKTQDEKGNSSKQSDKKEMTMQQAINVRNQVNQDRNEIIKIMKEKNISMEDATTIYFKENTERLKNYSLEERDFLLGISDLTQNQKDTDGKSTEDVEDNKKKLNGFSKFFKRILINRNKNVVEAIETELTDLDRKIEQAQKEDIDGESLFMSLKKSAKLKRELKNARKMDSKLNSNKSQKTPDEIFAERENKAILAEAVARYFKTGMSASEILQEIETNGNSTNIDIVDIISEIEKAAPKEMSPQNLTTLKSFEQKINEATLEITGLNALRENAAAQGRTDLVEKHTRKIAKLQNMINEKKDVTRGIRGTKSKDVINGEDKSQDVKADTTQQTLEVSEIETKEGIFPNIKNLIKKGKITTSAVKSSLDGITIAREQNEAEKNQRHSENVKDTQSAEVEAIIQ